MRAGRGIAAAASSSAARLRPPPRTWPLGALYQMVQRQANMLAFIDVFWALTIFIIVVLPIVFLLKRIPLERGPARGGEPPPRTPADTIRP
jgi:hypothetical protein